MEVKEKMFEEEGFSDERRDFRDPRDRFSRSQGPAPVKPGDEYDVTIESVGRKGDGIAKVENFVIFVAGTKAGDQVKVRIADVKGNFATASVVS